MSKEEKRLLKEPMPIPLSAKQEDVLPQSVSKTVKAKKNKEHIKKVPMSREGRKLIAEAIKKALGEKIAVQEPKKNKE